MIPRFAEHAPRRSGVVGPLALAGGLVVVSTILALVPIAQRWSGDVVLFERYAGLMFSGTLGKTPFLGWYPPLALVPLGLPLLGGAGTYAFFLSVEMAGFAAAGAMIVERLRPTIFAARSAFAIYGGLILAGTALIAWRYDLVPAVLTVASIWAAARRKWTLAGLAVGLAAGLKLYAVILIPLLLIHAWRTSGRRALLMATASAGAIGLASVAAYRLFPGSSPLDLLSFTANRPLQLETIPGIAIAALGAMGSIPVEIVFGSGSFNVIAPEADIALGALRLIQPVVLLVTIAVGSYAIWASRSTSRDRGLTLAMAATLLALLITNRVLSPQYLVWLLPLMPLIGGWLMALLVAAFGLTVIVFPWLYAPLLDLAPFPVGVVLVRNIVLVAAWGLAMYQLVRFPRSAAMLTRETANSTVKP